MNQTETPLPRVGVSACLLGHPVRYDGRDKLDPELNGEMAGKVVFVPVCPEAAIGLGVPRPPVRLVGDARRPQARGIENPTLDVTEKLESYARSQLIRFTGLSGFILKSNSPSCGIQGVRLFTPTGSIARQTSSGIFAHVLMEQLPQTPMEEEVKLDNPLMRSRFLVRVNTYFHWQQLARQGFTSQGLREFHNRHKDFIAPESAKTGEQLEQLLLDFSPNELEINARVYIAGLMAALKTAS